MRQPIPMTPALLASRFIGTKEIVGALDNPMIVAMLQSVDKSIEDDETAWCSAFVNFIALLMGCRMSRSLAARSWLKVGTDVRIEEARMGFHVVVLKRGDGEQPGPEVIAAPGHVGFFIEFDGENVTLLGGNQGNRVSLSKFPKSRILGVREI